MDFSVYETTVVRHIGLHWQGTSQVLKRSYHPVGFAPLKRGLLPFTQKSNVSVDLVYSVWYFIDHQESLLMYSVHKQSIHQKRCLAPDMSRDNESHQMTHVTRCLRTISILNCQDTELYWKKTAHAGRSMFSLCLRIKQFNHCILNIFSRKFSFFTIHFCQTYDRKPLFSCITHKHNSEDILSVPGNRGLQQNPSPKRADNTVQPFSPSGGHGKPFRLK